MRKNNAGLALEEVTDFSLQTTLALPCYHLPPPINWRQERVAWQQNGDTV